VTPLLGQANGGQSGQGLPRECRRLSGASSQRPAGEREAWLKLADEWLRLADSLDDLTRVASENAQQSQSAIYAREANMTHRSEEGRARAEAMFRKPEPPPKKSDKVWADRVATGRAADVNRAKLKEQRLARDAAEKPSTPKPSTPKGEKPPTGIKGEEISSHGQVDEGTKRRTRPQGSAK
jgi:hypothetical protein